MLNFIMIRHAPTQWNEQKKLQGLSDIPLSKKGTEIAQKWTLPENLHTCKICYASPLKRTKQTAEILCSQLQISIKTHPLLQEISFGIWEGQQLSSIRNRLNFIMQRLENDGLDFKAPKGESPRQAQKRIRKFLTQIPQNQNPTPENPILCITHKGLIRATYALASNWDMLGKPPQKINIDNHAHSFVLNNKGQISIDQINIQL